MLLAAPGTLADDPTQANSAPEQSAHDPGPRPNPTSPVPQPLPGLNHNEAALFKESLLRISELEGTCDTCSQQPPNVPPVDPDPNKPFSPRALVNSAGTGPVFNSDQCFICHSLQQIGGSSPRVNPARDWRPLRDHLRQPISA